MAHSQGCSIVNFGSGYESQDIPAVPFDWSLCCLCQKETTEHLVCPANSLRTDAGIGCGYTKLAEHLRRFKELNELPIDIRFSSLDDRQGMEETLTARRASFHKRCRSKCDNTTLQRLLKRKLHLTLTENETDNA